jgi:ubiquinone/menaquinone biosynthesis C-methylase UbiE
LIPGRRRPGLRSDRSYLTDRSHLMGKQYRDDANLEARISLHRRFGTNPYGWQHWIFDHFRGPRDARVLELGAGNGDLWLQNTDRIPLGWTITVTDLSPGMLEAARKRLAHIEQIASSSTVDAQEIPFAPNSFDLVIANAILYHVPDRPRAFTEIRRVLAPGGCFYAATFGRGHMRELYELMNDAADDSGAREQFTLENGREQLLPFFGDVQVARYEDALEVTDPGAVVAYLLSTRGAQELDATGRAALEERVSRYFQTAEVMHVTKSAGMFIAQLGS